MYTDMDFQTSGFFDHKVSEEIMCPGIIIELLENIYINLFYSHAWKL